MVCQSSPIRSARAKSAGTLIVAAMAGVATGTTVRHQGFHGQSRLRRAAKAYRLIHAFHGEIYQPEGCEQFNFNTRIPCIEIRQARYQPARSEYRRCRHHQWPADVPLLTRNVARSSWSNSSEMWLYASAAASFNTSVLPRLNNVTPGWSSSNLICWLAAVGVTCNSSAARIKERCRAAASKTRSELSGGKCRAISFRCSKLNKV